MNPIKLPDLIKIELKHFSLYSQKPSFTYEFVKGINLIIGGNGLGKTTFINIIKYALIGNYTHITEVRTYQGNRIEKRQSLDPYYFRDRMNQSYDNNENSKVILTFNVDDTTITITRNLYELKIEKVFVQNLNSSYYLDGLIISQNKYDQIPYTNTNERSKYLEYTYQEFLKDLCGFANFDDLIFFVSDILLFDERRKTLLWDKDIQIPLLSKYLNPASLDKEIEDLKRDIKYYDSLSRHTSEDIRAINKILERRNKVTDDSPSDKHKMLTELAKLKQSLNLLINKKNKIDAQVQQENRYISDLLSKKSQITSKCNSLEKSLAKLRADLYKKIWTNMNPKYEVYLKNISGNNLCPLCNNEIIGKHIIDNINNNKCILCDHDLSTNNTSNLETQEVETELNTLLSEKRNIEKEIISHQNTQSSYETSANEAYIKATKIREKIYNYEKMIQDNSDDPSDDERPLQLIYDEIKELENKKEKLTIIRDNLKNELSEKLDLMENRILLVTKDISSIFSKYAYDFLGMPSELIYDNNNGSKMYVPYINSTKRYTSYSLSESQSFFIDQSFRFSIINFFNSERESNCFYICETPDSSLDISYELNAAKIFIDFSNQPNTFIITSNFNNSRFIEYIISNSSIINSLNLLNIGNTSSIQMHNEDLLSISERIEVMINDKKQSRKN